MYTSIIHEYAIYLEFAEYHCKIFTKKHYDLYEDRKAISLGTHYI